MPGSAFRIIVLGLHGSGRHGGPGLPVQPAAAVGLVRDDRGIVEIERGGDVARQALDDDVDLLDVCSNILDLRLGDAGVAGPREAGSVASIAPFEAAGSAGRTRLPNRWTGCGPVWPGRFFQGRCLPAQARPAAITGRRSGTRPGVPARCRRYRARAVALRRTLRTTRLRSRRHAPGASRGCSRFRYRTAPE